MRTPDKIIAFCITPKTAQELATHCNVKLSSIYAPVGRLQVKGLLKRVGRGIATYVVTVPVITVVEENLVVKHAHNPFGLQT
jgi:predicted transcriptional regulator of viral defense system